MNVETSGPYLDPEIRYFHLFNNSSLYVRSSLPVCRCLRHFFVIHEIFATLNTRYSTIHFVSTKDGTLPPRPSLCPFELSLQLELDFDFPPL